MMEKNTRKIYSYFCSLFSNYVFYQCIRFLLLLEQIAVNLVMYKSTYLFSYNSEDQAAYHKSTQCLQR